MAERHADGPRFGIAVDAPGGAILELDQVDGTGLVGDDDVLRIGCPRDARAEAGAVLGDLAGLALAVGRHGPELVLAGGIAEVGDGLAIGAPRRAALEDAVGAREVAWRAVLRRRRPDVTARDHGHALARWRDARVLDGACGIDRGRPQGLTVTRDIDVDDRGDPRPEIQQHDPVAVLEDHLAVARVIGADGGPSDVVGIERGDLRGLARVEVVAPHVEHVPLGRAAVAQVVDLVAVPHRQRVGAFPVGDPTALAGLQVHEPHVGGHAAAIALPGSVVGRVRRVREPGPRAVDGAVGAVGNGQRRRQAARGGNRVELLRAVEAFDGAGHEDQALSIGRPVAQAFRGWVMRHALGDAARGGDRVQVERLVVVRAEGDGLPIGAEAGRSLEARRARDGPGDAA